eukprot:342404_1
MAEETKEEQHNIPNIARWDISVNSQHLKYSVHQRRVISSCEGNITARTVFLQRGRHIFNIKVFQIVAFVGIGICSRTYKSVPSSWVGQDAESYGTYSSPYWIGFYNNKELSDQLIHKTVIKNGS